MSDTTREAIELVMRQSECYNIVRIKQSLQANGNDIVATVYDLMMEQSASNITYVPSLVRDDRNDGFSDIREILQDKDQIFHKSNAEKR